MKKLLLLTLLLVTNYMFSQEECSKKCFEKYNPAAMADVDPCNYSEEQFNGKNGFFDCLCDCKKSKSESNSKTKKDEKETLGVMFSLYQQYGDMKTKADRMKDKGLQNSAEYKSLLKQMRITEAALRVPKNEYYDNPGYLNENTGNRYLDDANKKINSIKEESNALANNISDAIGNIIENNNKRKALEERRKRLEWNRKNKIKELQNEQKRIEELLKEKELTNLLKKYREKEKIAFGNQEKLIQKTVIENAHKYINILSCPNNCYKGEKTRIKKIKKTCTICDGKKTIYNYGKGGGHFGEYKPDEFMSCLSCDGKGHIFEKDYEEETCPVCNGDNHILEYVGVGHISEAEMQKKYDTKKTEINDYQKIRELFKKYPDIIFCPISSKENENKFGFVNRELNFIIEPKYKSAILVDIDKAVVSNIDGYGLINYADKILLPFDYDQIIKENDKLIIFTGNDIYQSNLDGTELILLDFWTETEFKNKNKIVKFKIIVKNGNKEFVSANNEKIAKSFEPLIINDWSGKIRVYKLINIDGTIDIFDEYTCKKTSLSMAKVEVIKEDLIKFQLNKNENKYGLLNKEGKLILEPNFELIQIVKTGYKNTIVARKFGDKKRKGHRYDLKGNYIEKVKLPK